MAKHNTALQVLVIAIATSLAIAARAQDLINPDRPGIADGSNTIKRGTLQIEAGAERDDHVDGREISTPALIRYGLNDRLELRVEGTGFHHVSSRSERSNGWAPVSLGFKAHLQEEDAKQHRPSLGVIGRLFVPSGSGDFRSDVATGDLRLAADLDLNEHWAINPNIGIAVYDDNGRFTAALAALTVQYNFTPKVNAFVDGGLQAPEERGGTSALTLDTGAAWIIGSDLQLDASIGWGAHGATPPRLFWSAGVSRRF